ncbi:unnamed protein product, partial [Urochloa humidicola]
DCFVYDLFACSQAKRRRERSLYDALQGDGGGKRSTARSGNSFATKARKEAAAAAQDLLKVDPAEAHKVAAAQSRKDAAAPMLKAQEEWSRVRDMLLVIKFVILET